MFEVRDALPDDVQEDIKKDTQIIWTDFQNCDMEYFLCNDECLCPCILS